MYLSFLDLYTHLHHASDKSQQATLDFNDYATNLLNHMLRRATHDGFCVEISQTMSRLDRKQKYCRACAARFHQSCMSFSVTNSRIVYQITQILTFSTQQKYKIGFWLMVVSTCELYLYQEIYRASRQFPFFGWVEASVMWHMGLSQWRPLFVDSRRLIVRSQNRSRMCEIRLTNLSCAAQWVGIVHFYAMTEIKGLSCHLRWIREWRNLLTSTHEKFAHFNTCGRAQLTGFRKLTARGITGFDCIGLMRKTSDSYWPDIGLIRKKRQMLLAWHWFD